MLPQPVMSPVHSHPHTPLAPLTTTLLNFAFITASFLMVLSMYIVQKHGLVWPGSERHVNGMTLCVSFHICSPECQRLGLLSLCRSLSTKTVGTTVCASLTWCLRSASCQLLSKFHCKALCGSVGRALCCAPKGGGYDSQSGRFDS